MAWLWCSIIVGNGISAVGATELSRLALTTITTIDLGSAWAAASPSPRPKAASGALNHNHGLHVNGVRLIMCAQATPLVTLALRHSQKRSVLPR